MTGYGVAAQARIRPDKVAFVHHDRRITYAELDAAAHRAAHVLRARGVGPEARLGIALANRPEWFVAALGAARLGAQCVPIPSGATADERDYFCTDGDVAYLLDEAALPEFLAALDATPAEPLADAAPDYVQLRAYTSGTTGRPKAVLRPDVDVAASIEGLVRYYTAYGLDAPDEVNVTGSPLHHLAGFSGPHSALLLGHTTVLLDHFDAAEWFGCGHGVRRDLLVVRAGAPLPDDERAGRREGGGRRLDDQAPAPRFGAVRAEPEAGGDGVLPARRGVGDLRRHRDDGHGHHRRGVGAQARQRRAGRSGLDDRDLRRRRQPAARGRGRAGLHRLRLGPWVPVLGRSVAHRVDLPRQPRHARRPRIPRRRRLPVRGRPPQGHGHHRRGQRVPGRGRGRARRPPGHRRGRGDRPARRRVRRDRHRGRRHRDAGRVAAPPT